MRGPVKHLETRNSQKRPKAGPLPQNQTLKADWSIVISRTTLPRHHQPRRNPRSRRSGTERRGRIEVTEATPTLRSSAKAILPQRRRPRRILTWKRSTKELTGWRWRTEETVDPNQHPVLATDGTKRVADRTLRLKAEATQSSSSIPAGSSEYSSLVAGVSNDELLMAGDHMKSSVKNPQSCTKARRM